MQCCLALVKDDSPVAHLVLSNHQLQTSGAAKHRHQQSLRNCFGTAGASFGESAPRTFEKQVSFLVMRGHFCACQDDL